MASRIRIYAGCSLDGFVAGPDDDLSWLPGDEVFADETPIPGVDGAGVGFEGFLAEVGAILMGRRTWDVFTGFDVPWPYGDRPVLVATHRPLEPDAPPGARPVEGTIEELVAEARAAAGDRDVYVDGGLLVGQALDAGLVDEMILTVVPTVLGRGVPVAGQAEGPHAFRLASVGRAAAGLVQLRLERAAASS